MLDQPPENTSRQKKRYQSSLIEQAKASNLDYAHIDAISKLGVDSLKVGIAHNFYYSHENNLVSFFSDSNMNVWQIFSQ